MDPLDPKTTALVLIDLQCGIVRMNTAPRSGTAVVQAGGDLATRFRAAGATVILVRVAFAPDFSDAPSGAVDQPIAVPPDGFPSDWSDLVDGLQQEGDIVVTKRHWGAFLGTELDLLLRRRGIAIIVLGGIATNFGVESTARHAYEHGYHVVLVEDVCAGPSADLHEMSVRHILPRLSRVVRAADVTFSLH